MSSTNYGGPIAKPGHLADIVFFMYVFISKVFDGRFCHQLGYPSKGLLYCALCVLPFDGVANIMEDIISGKRKLSFLRGTDCVCFCSSFVCNRFSSYSSDFG